MKEGCEAKKNKTQPNKPKTSKNNDQVLPNEVKATPRDKERKVGGLYNAPKTLCGSGCSAVHISQHLTFLFLDHAWTSTVMSF